LKKIIDILKEWKEEFWSIPLAFLLFFLSPYALRWIDPTAGVYDAGVFQIILFASICLLVFNGLAWVGVKIVFPEVFEYFQNKFKTDFNNLTTWEKSKISLFVFSLFFAALVLLARIL
jgi:signal transduction histidine kinase